MHTVFIDGSSGTTGLRIRERLAARRDVTLLELAAGWREKMLLGEMSGSDMAGLLGKLAVVLGPDGFNAFVDEYNHGKAPTP